MSVGKISQRTASVKNYKFVSSVASPADANFSSVSVLLHSDGSNGGVNNSYIDSSVNSVAVTPAGSPHQGSFSPFPPTPGGNIYGASTNGGSVYLNGSAGNNLSIGSNSWLAMGTSDFTVEAWVYLSNPLAFQGIFSSLSVTTGVGFNLVVSNSGTASFALGNGGSSNVASSATVLAANSWYHLAGVRSGSTIYLYVNGVQGGTTSSVTVGSVARSSDALIGRYYADGTDQYILNGYISGLRIVSGTALYTSNFSVPTAPPTVLSGTSFLMNFTNAAIFDSAAKNNFITVGNAQLSSTQAKFGATSISALTGTTYVKAPLTTNYSMGTGPFTCEAWLYRTSSATLGRVFQFTEGATFSGVSLYVTTGNALTLAMSASGSSWDLANNVNVGSITNNVWTHVALVRNGADVSFYINGTGGTVATISTGNIPYYAAGNSIVVGGGGDGTPFLGYIDEFRITKGVARYIGNFTPSAVPFPSF